MRLSTRSTYGMRALVELALASGRGPVSAALIATRQGLSAAYLEQLLHRLRRQGLVTSIRGPRGGYVLAKAPVQVTMAEVAETLDGGRGAGHGKILRAHGLVRSVSGPRAANGTLGHRGERGRRRGLSARQAGAPTSLRAPQRATWIAQAVWRCVHERLTQALHAVTLQDVRDEVRALGGDPLDHRHVFHI